MLDVNVELKKGIMFITLEGILNNETFKEFDMELNYLLYKQGINYFVIDFCKTEIINKSIIFRLENKFLEMFLNKGNITFKGFSNRNSNFIYDSYGECIYE